MSIYVDENTRVLVQGITGTAGTYHARGMRAYGTKVVGGVTPGRGGSKVDDIPVFETFARIAAPSDADASLHAPGARSPSRKGPKLVRTSFSTRRVRARNRRLTSRFLPSVRVSSTTEASGEVASRRAEVGLEVSSRPMSVPSVRAAISPGVMPGRTVTS